MLEFVWPWVFVLLPLPWLVWRWTRPAEPSVALRLPHRHLDLDIAFRGTASSIPRAGWWLGLAWLTLLLAAARPQWLGPPQAMARSGRALMLAVDLSGSMQTPDMRIGGRQLSRFAAVKAIAGDFIARRNGDQVGLILFGSRAYLVTPLTFDRHAVAAQLDGAAVGLAGRETAIGDAIAVAVRRMRALPVRARVLILLTDGVNTAGSITPSAAARIARAAGVRIYTIGIGAERMKVPGFFGQQLINPSADLDVHMLTRIARETGGRFFRATDTHELADAYRTIGALEPVAGRQAMLRPHIELFRWPLLVAIVLVLLAVEPWRRRREANA